MTLTGTRETRLHYACSRLREMVQALSPGAPLPTVRTLREQLGVSNTTLDAAMAVLEREGVLRRRQGSGIYVTEARDQRKLLLICDPTMLVAFGTSPFWQKLIDLTRQSATERGELFSLHFSSPTATDSHAVLYPAALHPAIVEEIGQKRVHGVLTIGLPHPVIRWIEAQGIPLVAFAGPANYMATIASDEIVQLGVPELIALGRRQIALWMPNGSDAETSGVRELFRGALLTHGLADAPLRVDWDAPAVSGVCSRTEQGYRLAMRHFGHADAPHSAPDAILSTDDMLTQGVLMAFQRLGLTPGREVAIATHANRDSPALLGWLNSITRIEFDTGEIVNLMIAMLEAQMAGDRPEQRFADYPQKAVQGIYRTEYQLMIQPRLIRPEECSN